MSYVQLNASLRGVDPKDKVTKTYPSIKTLIRIAEQLGIEVEDIFATNEVISRHMATTGNGGTLRCPNCGAELVLAKSPHTMTNEEIRTEVERLKAMVTDEPNYRPLTSEELAVLEKMRQEWNATHEEQIP